MKEQKKIGIFGGTFNPIHIGHVNVGVELLEKLDFDEIWYVPARISPLKLGEPPVSMAHRMKMLELALEENPRLIPKDLEGDGEGPSYTIDTMKDLLAKHDGNSYSFIMGEDAAESFSQWKNPLELLHLLPILVVCRNVQSFNSTLIPGLRVLSDDLIATRIIEVSSTELRDRLKKGLYCRHLMPEKVVDYICQNDLYSID